MPTTLKTTAIKDTSIEEVKLSTAVQTKLNRPAGISDAPSDGRMYGRKDGAWVVIDSPTPVTHRLNLTFDRDITILPYTATSGTFTVDSDWSAYEIANLISSGDIIVVKPYWLTLNLNTKTYSVAANLATSTRTDSIQIKYQGSNLSTYSISQYGQPAIPNIWIGFYGDVAHDETMTFGLVDTFETTPSVEYHTTYEDEVKINYDGTTNIITFKSLKRMHQFYLKNRDTGEETASYIMDTGYMPQARIELSPDLTKTNIHYGIICID